MNRETDRQAYRLTDRQIEGKQSCKHKQRDRLAHREIHQARMTAASTKPREKLSTLQKGICDIR